MSKLVNNYELSLWREEIGRYKNVLLETLHKPNTFSSDEQNKFINSLLEPSEKIGINIYGSLYNGYCKEITEEKIVAADGSQLKEYTYDINFNEELAWEFKNKFPVQPVRVIYPQGYYTMGNYVNNGVNVTNLYFNAQESVDNEKKYKTVVNLESVPYSLSQSSSIRKNIISFFESQGTKANNRYPIQQIIQWKKGSSFETRYPQTVKGITYKFIQFEQNGITYEYCNFVLTCDFFTKNVPQNNKPEEKDLTIISNGNVLSIKGFPVEINIPRTGIYYLPKPATGSYGKYFYMEGDYFIFTPISWLNPTFKTYSIQTTSSPTYYYFYHYHNSEQKQIGFKYVSIQDGMKETEENKGSVVFPPVAEGVEQPEKLPAGKINVINTNPNLNEGSRYFSNFSITKKLVTPKERHICSLGTSLSRNPFHAQEIQVTDNIDGTSSLTFCMYDTSKGKFGRNKQNPYVSLIREYDKIRVKHNGSEEIKDYIVKKIEYSRDESEKITYTCTDATIEELSKRGYGFSLPVEDNIGDIDFLASKVLQESEWGYIGNKDKFKEYRESYVIATDERGDYVGHEFDDEGNPKRIKEEKEHLVAVYNKELERVVNQYEVRKLQGDNIEGTITTTTSAVTFDGEKITSEKFEVAITGNIPGNLKVSIVTDGTIKGSIESLKNGTILNGTKTENTITLQLDTVTITGMGDIKVERTTAPGAPWNAQAILSQFTSDKTEKVYGHEKTDTISPFSCKELIVNGKDFTDTSGWTVVEQTINNKKEVNAIIIPFLQKPSSEEFNLQLEVQPGYKTDDGYIYGGNILELQNSSFRGTNHKIDPGVYFVKLNAGFAGIDGDVQMVISFIDNEQNTVWTTQEQPLNMGDIKNKYFAVQIPQEFKNFYIRLSFQDTRDNGQFISGSKPSSFWITEFSLFKATAVELVPVLKTENGKTDIYYENAVPILYKLYGGENEKGEQLDKDEFGNLEAVAINPITSKGNEILTTTSFFTPESFQWSPSYTTLSMEYFTVSSKDENVTYPKTWQSGDKVLQKTFTPVKTSIKERTLEIEKSNYFAALQQIATLFEAYPRFVRYIDENGNLTKDSIEGIDVNGNSFFIPLKRNKFVKFEPIAGKKTGLAFKYKRNLNNITRTKDTEELITKLFVSDIDNDALALGKVSIGFSDQNESGENYIYDLFWLAEQGYISYAALLDDLYGNEDSGGLSLYSTLKRINHDLSNEVDGILLLKERYETQLKLLNDAIEFHTLSLGDIETQIGEQEAIKKAKKEEGWEKDIENELLTYYSDYIIVPKSGRLEKGVVSVSEAYKNLGDESPVKDRIKVLIGDWRDGITTCEDTESSVYKDYQDAERVLISLNKKKTSLTTNLNKMDEEKTALETEINRLSSIETPLIEQKKSLIAAFEEKYHLYIKEGTWGGENYTNNDEYFMDAREVASQASRPKIEYSLTVTDLSFMKGYEAYKVGVGDIVMVEDTELFGYDENGAPKQYEFIISEIQWNLSNPAETQITVRNYNTPFEEFFGKTYSTVTAKNTK